MLSIASGLSATLQASPYTAGADTYKFSDPCDYFTYGKAKASTLSLSVLVAIEMFNAMNALSEVSHRHCLHCLLHGMHHIRSASEQKGDLYCGKLLGHCSCANRGTVYRQLCL